MKYKKIVYNLVRHDYQIFPVKQVVVLPVEKKILMARYIKNKTAASYFQIAKFLHLDLESEDKMVIDR